MFNEIRKYSSYIFAGIIILFVGYFLYESYVDKNDQNIAKNVKTTQKNTAKAITLNGYMQVNKLRETKIKPGFYDVEVVKSKSGKVNSFLAGTITKKLSARSILLTGSSGFTIEKGDEIKLIPSNFEPLKKKGNAYIISKPGYYRIGIDIKPGLYEVTAQGNLNNAPSKSIKEQVLSITQTINGVDWSNEPNDSISIYKNLPSGVTNLKKGNFLVTNFQSFYPGTAQLVLTPTNKTVKEDQKGREDNAPSTSSNK